MQRVCAAWPDPVLSVCPAAQRSPRFTPARRSRTGPRLCKRDSPTWMPHTPHSLDAQRSLHADFLSRNKHRCAASTHTAKLLFFVSMAQSLQTFCDHRIENDLQSPALPGTARGCPSPGPAQGAIQGDEDFPKLALILLPHSRIPAGHWHALPCELAACLQIAYFGTHCPVAVRRMQCAALPVAARAQGLPRLAGHPRSAAVSALLRGATRERRQPKVGAPDLPAAAPARSAGACVLLC